MANTFSADSIKINNQNITVTGNSIYLNDVWIGQIHVSGSAPSASLLTVPISINTYGGLSRLLGQPDLWIPMQISGITYKVGAYV